MRKFILKVTIIFYSIVGFLIWLGSIPDHDMKPQQLPPLPVSAKGSTPWSQADKEAMEKLYDNDFGEVKSFSTPDDYPSWCRPQSAEWDDFLEDLEARGITVWDPDAKEIWEEYH